MNAKRQLTVAVIFVLLVLFSFVILVGLLVINIWEGQIYCWLAEGYGISYTEFLKDLLTVNRGLLVFDSLIIILYSALCLYEYRRRGK